MSKPDGKAVVSWDYLTSSLHCYRLMKYVLLAGWLCLSPALAQNERSTAAGHAVAVDHAGDVFVAGWMESNSAEGDRGKADAFLAKFDTNGEPHWLRQFGSDQSDYALAVAVDAAGNVVVASSTSGDLAGANQGEADAFLAKFDTDGELLWLRQFGSARRDSARGVAVDGDRNILVAGTQADDEQSDVDAFIAKYDTEGRQLWLRSFSVEAHTTSRGVSLDLAGNVYAAGSTSKEPFHASPAGTDVYAAKFDADGQQLWVTQFGDILDDIAYAMQVDRDGNTFVTGGTDSDQELGVLEYEIRQGLSVDAFLAKVDTHGQIVWIRQFGAGRSYSGQDVAVDGVGNAIVVGRGNGDLGSEPQGLSDAFIAKYDLHGTRLWVDQFGTSEFDGAYGVAVDATDHIFMTGYLEADWRIPYDRGRYAFLAKYDPNGNQLWLQTFGSPSTMR